MRNEKWEMERGYCQFLTKLFLFERPSEPFHLIWWVRSDWPARHGLGPVRHRRSIYLVGSGGGLLRIVINSGA